MKQHTITLIITAGDDDGVSDDDICDMVERIPYVVQVNVAHHIEENL